MDLIIDKLMQLIEALHTTADYLSEYCDFVEDVHPPLFKDHYDDNEASESGKDQ